MKRILFLIPLISSLAFGIDKVQIVNDSEADKVTIAGQKIEISSASFLNLVSSNGFTVGTVSNSTYAFTINSATQTVISGGIYFQTLRSGLIQRSTDTGSCHRIDISSLNLVTARGVACP